MAADVRIDIAAQFVGKKAFKEAETSTDKLSKNVKGLAKSLLAVYSAQKILSYAKASVKAFAEDDKAATALGTTLKNLGLAYGSNIGTVNGFINRLEMQTGVLDDELRPAMDRMLRATGDVTKSQELLGLALDISAGTGKSLTQVSQSLQKAYLGQTQALGRLGVGLTKTELSTSSFEEIQARLAVLFAGQATAAADTYAGSLAKLTVAGNNAKETIGEGLVDAIKTASGSQTLDPLINGIDRIAKAIAGLARETGEFIAITKSIFDFDLFAKDLNAFKGMGNISMTVSSQDTQKADAIAKKNATAITKLTKEQAASQAKILKDKKLSAAIDKANLLLGKGTDVFDIEKIQNQAALINQAEILAKTTNASQILAITNDVARLNVKKAISDLEDAIASKDEAAITAATKKLNAELAIFNAINQQNIKLLDIKTVLDSLKSKDLINLENLNAALALLAKIGTMGIAGSTTTSITSDAAAQATALLAAKTAADKAAAEAAAAAAAATKAAVDAATAAAAEKAAKDKAAAEAALAAAKALTEEEKAKAAAAAAAAAAQIAALEAANKLAADYAAALLEAADAAAAAADALGVAGTSTGETTTGSGLATIIGETGAEVSKLVDGLATVFQTVEDSGAFNALVNSFAGGAIGSFNAGTFRGNEGGSLFNSGAVGSRDINITVNAGVGDPNAIAEAIENLLREANSRGTLTSGILGIG